MNDPKATDEFLQETEKKGGKKSHFTIPVHIDKLVKRYQKNHKAETGVHINKQKVLWLILEHGRQAVENSL